MEVLAALLVAKVSILLVLFWVMVVITIWERLVNRTVILEALQVILVREVAVVVLARLEFIFLTEISCTMGGAVDNGLLLVQHTQVVDQVVGVMTMVTVISVWKEDLVEEGRVVEMVQREVTEKLTLGAVEAGEAETVSGEYPETAGVESW